MERVEPPTTTDSTNPQPADFDMPLGNHALEVAARAGIGPLSLLGRNVWHGDAKPCVSCGQLVRRGTKECDHCEQDLRQEMVEKMRIHAGPWYVLEHVRPFPGVSLERIIRQVRRGLITDSSIVRGPATDHQWRFAVETPGLCRFFGKCWDCLREVAPTQTYCPHCHSFLMFEHAKPASTEPSANASVALPIAQEPVEATGPRLHSSGELAELSAAVNEADLPVQEPLWDDPPRVAGIRATWVVLTVLVIVIASLVVLTQSRNEQVRSAPTAVQQQP